MDLSDIEWKSFVTETDNSPDHVDCMLAERARSVMAYASFLLVATQHLKQLDSSLFGFEQLQIGFE